MSQWEARRETIIRGDVARSAHQRSEISASGSRDRRERPIVKKDRAIHAGGDSPPTHPDAFHLQTAECTSARMHPVHRSVDLVGEAQQAGDAVIVVLAGEFDLAASTPVRDALTRAIREPHQRLTVDLRAVTFIDASGLHVILDAYKLCRDAGRTLTIRPGPPHVQRVFELTNLVDYLPFEAGE